VCIFIVRGSRARYRFSPRDARAHLTLNLPINPKNSTHTTSTNMDPMKAALAALDSLKPGERLNYTATAKKFGIGRDALSRRHRGI
jgi:hypothetical protein